jgi:Pyridoxamine 5'-phosphate oxidase
MATLRRDGSPRISGTEVDFADGEVWFGSMPGAVKARDLQRDPRVAVHRATVDPKLADGDAKLAGTAEEITDEEGKAAAAAPISRPARTPVSLRHHRARRHERRRRQLVIESWHEGRGVEHRERR